MKFLKSLFLFCLLSIAFSYGNAQTVLISKTAGKVTIGDKADSPWEHLEGMYSDTTNQATCSLQPGQNSDNIILSNFNFSIPEGAAIKGVLITLERQGGTMGFIDKTVKLVVAGQAAGNNYALNDYWRTDITRINYGSETNTWGLTLKPSDVNSPDFGVMLQVANSDMGSESTAQYGFVRISVNYVIASGESVTVNKPVKSIGTN